MRSAVLSMSLLATLCAGGLCACGLCACGRVGRARVAHRSSGELRRRHHHAPPARRARDQHRLPVVEIRDAAAAPNFLTACITAVVGLTACGNASECLDGMVGSRVSMRGNFRVSNQSPGGYRISLTRLPTEPSPAVP